MKGSTTAKTVSEYLKSLEGDRKKDIKALHDVIRKVAPKLDQKMYKGIIGYGGYPYKTKSGCKGDWFVMGLASQKNYISLYACLIEDGQYVAEKYKDDFPKANVGKSCIRFKKLDDIDLKKVEKLVKKAVKAFETKKGLLTF